MIAEGYPADGGFLFDCGCMVLMFAPNPLRGHGRRSFAFRPCSAGCPNHDQARALMAESGPITVRELPP